MTFMTTKSKFVGVVAVLLASVLPIEAIAAPWAPNSINIGNNRGGRILDYAIRVKEAEKSGKTVRFRGSCASACTLYLSLPRSRTCISPGAKFSFHLPYGASSRGNRVAANYLQRSYPGWVRSWIRANGGLTNRLKTMDYAYASKFLPPCKTRTVKVRNAKNQKLKGFSHKVRFGFR